MPAKGRWELIRCLKVEGLLHRQLHTHTHTHVYIYIYIYIYYVDEIIKADASLSLLSPRFDPGTHNVTFVLSRRVFLLVLPPFPVSATATTLYAHFVLIIFLSEGQAGNAEKSLKI